MLCFTLDFIHTRHDCSISNTIINDIVVYLFSKFTILFIFRDVLPQNISFSVYPCLRYSNSLNYILLCTHWGDFVSNYFINDSAIHRFQKIAFLLIFAPNLASLHINSARRTSTYSP